MADVTSTPKDSGDNGWLLIPKILVVIPIIIGGYLMLAHSLWWGAMIPILSGFALYFGLMEVPLTDPASVGLLTVWGKPKFRVITPQILLLAPYFPFNIGFMSIDIENQNLDFTFPDIRFRLKDTDIKSDAVEFGAEGEIDVSITIKAMEDGESLMSYVRAGGRSKTTTLTPETRTALHDQIRDILGETLRREAAGKTAEEMTFAQLKTAALLMKRLTGQECTPRGESETEEVYQERLSKFLEETLKVGAKDVHNFGIIFLRVNVVRIFLTGEEMKKDAELAAREKQQIRKQSLEQAARREEASKMVEAAKASGDETLTFERALAILRVDEGKANERIDRVYVESSGDPLKDAAAIVRGGLGNA